MWILFLISTLGFFSPYSVHCQTGTGGSNIQWKANMGGGATGGIPINSKSKSKFDWSSLGHLRTSSVVSKRVPELPTTNNRVNSVKSKKPLKFSREFLKLLAGANELGPLKKRVWSSTTTTTPSPPVPPPIASTSVSSPSSKQIGAMPPRPSQLLTDMGNPPPPPPIDSRSSGFKVGRRNPSSLGPRRDPPSLGASKDPPSLGARRNPSNLGERRDPPNLGAILESQNILSNGGSSTKSQPDVTNALTNGNGSIMKEQKPKSTTPKTHNRKKFNKEIQPVPHIAEQTRSRPSLSGGMSLFDVVNSKPGFEEYVRLNQEAETTVHSAIDTTTTTTTIIKSVSTTTTKAPVAPKQQTTTTTTAKPATTTAPKKEASPMFMVHSSLSQPLQFAEQLRQQGVELGKGLRSSSQDQSPQNTGQSNSMDDILAQLRSSSSSSSSSGPQQPSGQGFGGQSNNNQMSNQMRNRNNNRNNMNRQSGRGGKGEMATFLASLSAEQRRMFRDILGRDPAPTTPVPTTTTVMPPMGNMNPNMLKMMKAMGINPGNMANLLSKIGIGGGNNRNNGRRKNTGPDKPGGRKRGLGPGGNRGNNNNNNNNNNNRNRGGNFGPPGRNNGGGGGGGNNNFGPMGGGNAGGGGLESMFGSGGNGGLGGPDMSQMMSMLSGGGGGGQGGGMNALSALMGSGGEGGLGGLGALGAMMGGGPMGGGRGNRGQRRMMPGGPNADPQTRRILMNRLLKRGMRPGADPADPPETPALGEGMMGGSGGLGGLMGGPSAAWMGGGGGSGGRGGFPGMNMGGSGGGGEGGGLGGLAGMMSMFGGGGSGGEGMAGAGGLGPMMGGGGEGGMNPMMLSLLAGGDPADIPFADAPPGRGMGMGGGLRGFGGLPMVKRREAGPAPRPKDTPASVSTSTKSKSSPAQSKNTKDTKINSNVQSIFSYSLARKTIHSRFKEIDKSPKTTSEPPKSDNTGISLEGKNSRALVEFVPLDILPKHLLPKLKSLLKEMPKHRRRPSPDTSITDLSNEIHKTNSSDNKNLSKDINSSDSSKTNLSNITSSESIIETIRNISQTANFNGTVSLQKRFSNLPRRRPFDPNWQQPFDKYIKLAPRLDKPGGSLGSPVSGRTGRQNGDSSVGNNLNRNSGAPANDFTSSWSGTSNNRVSSSSSWSARSNGWNTPRNMVINAPGELSSRWTQQNLPNGMSNPSVNGFPPTTSWQNSQQNFNPNQNRWRPNPAITPQRPRQPPSPTNWQYQNYPQQAWGPPPLPERRSQGPSLPNTRPPSPPQTQQWQSQSTNQWQSQIRNPSNGQAWNEPANNFRQNQPPPQSNVVYNPQARLPATPRTLQPWDSGQNYNPPTTQRPWRATPRPWQSQPPNPQGSKQFFRSSQPRQSSHLNSFSNRDSFTGNQGQSSWVEIKPNQRQKTHSWNEGPTNGPFSNSRRGGQPANSFQQFNRKQPNVVDNTRQNSFMDPSNKGAFGQNSPTQPPPSPKTTQIPPTAPWNSPAVITQAPPPPQWPLPGAQNQPMPTAGQQNSPTEPWGATNQQSQSWTSAPQFAGQQTTQPASAVTSSWNAGSSQFGRASNNQFGGAGTSSFSNNNFGSPPTTQPFNSMGNQNFGGPTTSSYFRPQSFGKTNTAGASSAFGGGMMGAFADRLVTGPGIPPGYILPIQGDHISDIMGGGPGLAARLPPDIKLQAAKMSLAGQSGDTIADVLGLEMKRRRRLGLLGNSMMGRAEQFQ